MRRNGNLMKMGESDDIFKVIIDVSKYVLTKFLEME